MGVAAKFVDVSKPNSNFKFIATYCKEEANGGVNRAMHRLCSLMRKMNAITAIVEEIEESEKSITEECLALDVYCQRKTDKTINKLTFVSKNITSVKELEGVDNQFFLSSAIVINYKDSKDAWQSYVYSAIVTTLKKPDGDSYLPLLNNFLHIFKKFDCDVLGKKFQITGSFFAQQNGITSVCAHATLCMTINNMPLKVERTVSSEYINKIIGVDHNKIKFNESKIGLTKEEILRVLNTIGLAFIVKDHFTDVDEEYNDFIYKYIESRFPALLVFTTNDSSSHIVPILGHTLNTDMWRPEAELAYNKGISTKYYKPASAYVDHFIIHDDNFGMYFSLPVESLRKSVMPKYDHRFRAYYTIVIVPDGVKTPSWEAEQASLSIANRFLSIPGAVDEWSERLRKKDRPWVIRTFVVDKEDYAASLSDEDFNGTKFTPENIDQLLLGLPERFWLSEISLPDLYVANKSKIIEVLYPANLEQLRDNDDIYNRWLQIRFPSALIKRKGSSLDVIKMAVSGHYPLLRLDTEFDTLDW